MTSMSKNVYIDKLDDKVNKYNNTYYSTNKMKPVDVQSGTYIDSGIENNYKNLKFKVGDHVRIPKYKNICTPNWTEDAFVVKKVKSIVLQTYVIEYSRENVINYLSNGEVMIILLTVG